VRDPIKEGIVPDMLVENMPSQSSRPSLPIEEGIDPLTKVRSRYSEYRFESEPIDEESEPERLFSCRDKDLN
jgi:hypothetical protein